MTKAVLERPGDDFPETIAPTEEEALVAKESVRALSQVRLTDKGNVRLRIHEDGSDAEIEIPGSAFRFLRDVLAEMALGHAVTFIPTHAELTTQQAADILNVSRPFLVGLLDSNQIPHRLVGTHRRVRFSDLVDYKRRADAARRAAIVALMEQSEELDMGY